VTGLYDAAEAYQLAFSYRDVAGEVETLQRWYGGRPGSVLELAAGPAEHAVEFARRGARAAALDRSAAMCERARRNADRAGVALCVHRADMTGFALGERFDLAFCMIDSIAHVLTLDALVAHLDAVRRHLRDGGRYVVESGHPAEYLAASKRVETEWDVERDGHRVHIRWGSPDDRMDPVTQVTPYRVTITVDGAVAADEVVANRFWTATELDAAGRLAGLRVAARYGDLRDDLDVSDEQAWRMFTVYCRAG
jgi:SAM-dependent methyltransferase